MTDEELIRMFRNDPTWMGRDIADRIETLVKERDEARSAWEIEASALKRLAERHEQNLVLGAETRARAERLEAAADYILDGIGIDAPDYEIDPDEDFLDAANSDWVRDVLMRLSAAMKGTE